MDIIERAEDQDKLILQNSIKYLDSLTQVKDLNVPTIKSLYRTKCRLMELRRHCYLQKQKPNQTCQHCFMHFSEGTCTKHEVRPVKLSSFAKKIIAKAEKNAILTSYQRLYYKKLLKRFPHGFQSQNILVLTCSFCKKETKVWMNKPEVKKAVKNKTNVPAKRKRSKKKDKFCGLDESAVSLSSLDDKIKVSNKANGYKATRESAKSTLNSSMSLVSNRVFQTSDFIPLDTHSKGRHKIKLSEKKENVIEKVTKPDLPGVVKVKERLKKKNQNSLLSMLKKANEKKNKRPSKLKEFLAGL